MTTEALSDSAALIGRNMKHLRRVPEKLISITITPVAMVVVFGYLFGSSMVLPGSGGDYTEYIMAGIFAQVMLSVFGTTALGISGDLHNGLVDRFRSLPISHTAVLIGRTVSDMTLIVISCVVMAGVGYLIGWRSHGLAGTLAGFVPLVLLGFVMSWMGAWVGLALRQPEAVNAVTLFVTMPLAFLSASFFPLGNLPSWLRVIAEWNPVSAVTTASRDAWGNPTAVGDDAALPVRHPMAFSLITLTVALLAVVPLASKAFRRAVAR